MTTHTFQPIGAYRVKTGKCPICGKTTKRSKRFEHTVNPFNRNPDGTVCTVDEVRACVNAEADAWEPDFTHAKCASETGERR